MSLPATIRAILHRAESVEVERAEDVPHGFIVVHRFKIAAVFAEIRLDHGVAELEIDQHRRHPRGADVGRHPGAFDGADALRRAQVRPNAPNRVVHQRNFLAVVFVVHHGAPGGVGAFQHEQRRVIVESVRREMRAERQVEIAPGHGDGAQIFARAEQFRVARAIDERAALEHGRIGNGGRALEHGIEGQQSQRFGASGEVDVNVAALVAEHIDVLAVGRIDVIALPGLRAASSAYSGNMPLT